MRFAGFKLALIMLLAGCAASGKFDQAYQGRKIFYQKCSNCHSLPDVNQYSYDEWVKIIDKMSKDQVELTDEEKLKLLKFIKKFGSSHAGGS